jgi:spermidine synthase
MEYVEIARAESERGELVLRERRAEGAAPVLELRANGVFVMDNAEFASEQALATAGLELVAEPRDVLVAGLGLGFTMHQVLADPRVHRCTVVEIEEALIRWMRDGTVPHGQTMLADERAHPVVGDIAVAIEEARDASYDLVLIDVDNGPHFLVHEANAAVYQQQFLRQVQRILRPSGVLVIWSMDRSEDLLATLGEVFGSAEAKPLDVWLQERDEQYWLHLARSG